MKQEAANQYAEQLAQRSRARFHQWNAVVREVAALTDPLIVRKTELVVRAHNIPKGFVSCVQWNILHLAMEGTYADVYQPRFYVSPSYWYANGHFPCGWKGHVPKRKTIVY